MKILSNYLSNLIRFVSLLFLLISINGCIERTYFVKWNNLSKPQILLHWTGDSIDVENGTIPNYSNDWKFNAPEAGSEDIQHSFNQFGVWDAEILFNRVIELLPKSPISPNVIFQRFHLGFIRYHKFLVKLPASTEVPLENPMENAPKEPDWENDTTLTLLSQQTKQELQKQYELSILTFYVDQYEDVLKMIQDSIGIPNRDRPSQWSTIQKERFFSSLDTTNPINNSLDYWTYLKDSVLPTTLPIEVIPKAIKVANSIEEIHQLYQDLSDEKVNFRLIKSGFLLSTNADSIDRDTLKWDITSDRFAEKKTIELLATFIVFDAMGTGIILAILILLIVYKVARKQKKNESN